jgi:hypothetical protein
MALQREPQRWEMTIKLADPLNGFDKLKTVAEAAVCSDLNLSLPHA